VYGEIWKKEDAVVNVCSKAKESSHASGTMHLVNIFTK